MKVCYNFSNTLIFLKQAYPTWCHNSLWNICKFGILLPKLSLPTVRKNCSSDREKFLAFSLEFPQFLRSLEQFSSDERLEEFLVAECFFYFSWRFFRATRTIRIIIGKNIGFRKVRMWYLSTSGIDLLFKSLPKLQLTRQIDLIMLYN